MTLERARDDGRKVDLELLEIGLRLTPAERLEWLERTVEELRPWVGLAARDDGSGGADDPRDPPTWGSSCRRDASPELASLLA